MVPYRLEHHGRSAGVGGCHKGSRGFRAWLQPATDEVEVCPCNWAPELGQHYGVARVWR